MYASNSGSVLEVKFYFMRIAIDVNDRVTLMLMPGGAGWSSDDREPKPTHVVHGVVGFDVS